LKSSSLKNKDSKDKIKSILSSSKKKLNSRSNSNASRMSISSQSSLRSRKQARTLKENSSYVVNNMGSSVMY
jgi:hypothetical protein